MDKDTLLRGRARDVQDLVFALKLMYSREAEEKKKARQVKDDSLLPSQIEVY